MQIWSTNSGWFQVFKYENNQFINWSNIRSLMLKMVKMKRATQFKFGATMDPKPKNGKSFILIKQKRKTLRV